MPWPPASRLRTDTAGRNVPISTIAVRPQIGARKTFRFRSAVARRCRSVKRSREERRMTDNRLPGGTPRPGAKPLKDIVRNKIVAELDHMNPDRSLVLSDDGGKELLL